MKAYHLNGPAPLFTNTFLLISDAKHAVVIDPAAGAADYDRILKQEGAILTDIFCTHGHSDHVGAAEALRGEWNAKLWCEAADVCGTQLFPLTLTDGGYAEGAEIRVDELTFRAWHTPGHTKGSVCILCGELFFTGDTLFAGDTGRTDLPGGSFDEMVASCKKIMRLPVPAQAKVLPGHEDFSTYAYEMAHNGFIDAMCR